MAPAVNAATGSAGTASPGYSGLSDGVPTSAKLSRVPYNQAAINDVNNQLAFKMGLLKKYWNIACKRDITGNQYILECQYH